MSHRIRSRGEGRPLDRRMIDGRVIVSRGELYGTVLVAVGSRVAFAVKSFSSQPRVAYGSRYCVIIVERSAFLLKE